MEEGIEGKKASASLLNQVSGECTLCCHKKASAAV